MANVDGITNPPIDELLDKAGSKYSLVLYAAKRARQTTVRTLVNRRIESSVKNRLKFVREKIASGDKAAAVSAASKACTSSSERALSRSGRLSVSSSVPPRRSTRTAGCIRASSMSPTSRTGCSDTAVS